MPKRRRARRAALPALLALLLSATALAASPASSPASPKQFTIFDAAGGLLSVPPAGQAQTLDRVKDLGADVVRIVVPWRSFAPSPGSSRKPSGFDATNSLDYPAAPFATLDNAISEAEKRGLVVLLTPSAPMPDWASASGNSTVENPDTDEYRQFVTALGDRYSGHFSFCPSCTCVTSNVCVGGTVTAPPVFFWSVWNEPNIPIFLRPQHENGRAVAGQIYRRLWFSARSALNATGHGNDPMLIGETSPGPGRGGTAPVAFMRQVLCLDSSYHLRPSCEPVNAIGWAQHPYDPYDPPFRTSRGLITIRSMNRLESALIKAARAGATTTGLPVFVTEYGIESVPDPQFGVSQRRQAEYLGIAEYLLYRDPNVLSYAQYLMQDDGGGLLYSFQSGLRFNNDSPKLSYDAFPIPLVAQRRSRAAHRVHIWGEVRPGTGPYDVHVLYRNGGGSGRLLRTVRTDGAGYFSFSAPYRSGRSWRAIARSPSGALLKGPYIHSFVFR